MSNSVIVRQELNNSKETLQIVMNINYNTLIFFIYLVASIIFYDFYLLKLYQINDFTMMNRNYVLSQYAFTYQNMGFVARGLLPSIFELIKLNNKCTYYIFYNIVLIFYVITIIYLGIKYAYQYRNRFIITILFLYFGIFHFTIDTMRTDMLIILFSLWIFILLDNNKKIISVLISIISLFIHEASFFLIVPIFVLFNRTKYKTLFIIFILSTIFLLITFLSNKTTENNAIEMISDFPDITQIKKMFYIGFTSGIIENITFYFSTINNYFLILILVVGISIYIFCFRELFTKKLAQKNIFAFFPLLLCLVAIDYSRWLHFSFILLMLYAIKQNLFNDKIFKRLVYCLPISIVFNSSIVILIISIFKYIFVS